MSLEFHKLKPKRFAKKSFKHSQESRYWKKFQSVLLEKEGDAGGMLRSDLSFCPSATDKPNLFATAVSARVDIYRLTQPEQGDEENEVKPVQKIQKFKDIATAVQLRQDGNIVLCGEKTGKIQLVELQNKFVLKTYEEHSNQINAFAFKSTMREFIVAANDTNIKVFDILEQQSVLSIHGAHSDNIKRVRYLDDTHIISASADRTVRLWDIRATGQGPLDSVKLSLGAEDFCMVGKMMVVANGPVLSCLEIGEDKKFKKLAEYQSFQRPVMRVRWDATRERLLAAGLDSQMKVFSLEHTEENTPILKVAYKVKLPEEVSCLDISLDGNHYAMGLATGALVIKSKQLSEEDDKETDEQKLIKNALQSSFVSKAKGYKYFYRGQYASLVLPDSEDTAVVAERQARMAKLMPYEQSLKRFEYRNALNQAISTANPEVVLALIEELIERGALERALAGRDVKELGKVMEFIRWKLADHRYQGVLCEVARVLLDMYSAPITLCGDKEAIKMINELRDLVERDIKVQVQLKEIGGQLDLMFRMASAVTQARAQ
ncbi:hypothetical protein FGO68_gene11371 [Halteria grandinella]|uniref:U3 small nucleolar RNA-associated protein 15 C-terminal domain-containing protein n=1 Tax=Halteria grandinella TaxID=5974 RepID=A0A8J8T2Y4_HALGN|nr:hypothetical protein FGO68_gene11371 [Halteria grandinella]